MHKNLIQRISEFLEWVICESFLMSIILYIQYLHFILATICYFLCIIKSTKMKSFLSTIWLGLPTAAGDSNC